MKTLRTVALSAGVRPSVVPAHRPAACREDLDERQDAVSPLIRAVSHQHLAAAPEPVMLARHGVHPTGPAP